MALQKQFDDAFGGVNTTAYYKVIQTNISWLEKKAYVVLGIYKDKKARDDNKNPVGAQEYLFPMEVEIGTPELPVKKEIKFDSFFGVTAKGKNASEQAYLAVKELPEYKNATSV